MFQSDMQETVKRRRIPANDKIDAVLRVLKGETVQGLAAELKVSVSAVERWTTVFTEAGAEALRLRSERHRHHGNGGSKRFTDFVQWALVLLLLVVLIYALLGLFQ